MDVHVPRAITDQLRRRGVDVLTANEEAKTRWSDEDLLEYAWKVNRVIFTHDVGFKTMAEEWQRQGRPFAGLLFGKQMHVSIGQYVRDLELIAKRVFLKVTQRALSDLRCSH
ncbi:MAG: DUF5615 family PIN-like protein [Gemmataceae bacterium]